MAKTPPIKIYRGDEYVGALWYAEDAAAICGMSAGTEARLGHERRFTIFREPADNEPWSAANSWDAAGRIMRENMARIRNGQPPVLAAPFPWGESIVLPEVR